MSFRAPLPYTLSIALAFLAFAAALPAQTPPPPAKRLPPAGVVIPQAVRAELQAGADTLRREIDALAAEFAAKPRTPLTALLPDVEIFHKAVDWALRYDEFFELKHTDLARQLLVRGHERAAQLRAGTAPWVDATGVVIRGHRSALDGSVQPYAVTLPPDWQRGRGPARRLDVVLLGRGEKRTELAFFAERERPAGANDIVPAGAIVLVPYGRYCNATKFAGEVDVFEALAAVRTAYPVDGDRIVVRGFSMGGASTWHLATHYPGMWAAAAPGAGFAETPVYTKAFAPGKPERTWWEQKLWHWYNATDYAANLRTVPTVAYSGEIDPQKQAADIMAEAMAAEGLKLEHLIGPQTAHKYHPVSKAALSHRLDDLTRVGRSRWPREDHFTTYTLRYSASRRIKIMELGKSWERADVDVRAPAAHTFAISTRNVGVFNFALEKTDGVTLTIDGQPIAIERAQPGSWFVKTDGRWALHDAAFGEARWRHHRRKVPGLSGPIDDAFMSPFLFVRPTGAPLNPALGRWVQAELAHATRMWRDLFRGDVVVKDDTAVTPADLAERNVVLWGDPASNRLLAKMLGENQLPLSWNARDLTFRGKTYAADHHAPVLVFPNPLSPKARYVVLNSGIDFRDEAYGTNALQTPKLPDFAIIDLREPAGPRWPGRIVEAGFFDETWK